eukprot:scaffold17726_cov135-Skeletonema_dohrnii-CCMP3373.AAC.2
MKILLGRRQRGSPVFEDLCEIVLHALKERKMKSTVALSSQNGGIGEDEDVCSNYKTTQRDVFFY